MMRSVVRIWCASHFALSRMSCGPAKLPGSSLEVGHKCQCENKDSSRFNGSLSIDERLVLTKVTAVSWTAF
jgi:hypothetical protein